MAWYVKNTKELWLGAVHTLHGFTWTNANHMSHSVKLEEGDAPVVKRVPRVIINMIDPPIAEYKKKPVKKKKVK